MKNMRKLFGFTALAVVIVLSLALTACGDLEYSYTFENISEHIIQVKCPELTPSSFELKGLADPMFDDPETQETTSKKSKISYEWTIKGKTADESKREVLAVPSGSKVTFKKNPNGSAKITTVEE